MEEIEYSIEEWDKNDVDKKKIGDLLWVSRALSRYIKQDRDKGSLSARVPGGIIISALDSETSKLSEDDFSFVHNLNSDEKKAEANGKKPSNETFMNYLAYQKRGNINYMLHFFDPRLERVRLPYSIVGPFENGTKEEAEGMAKAVLEGNAIVVKNNGFLVVGKTREELLSYLDRMYFSLEVAPLD